VYDPKVGRKKILSDLDYLATRSSEANAESTDSFDNPYDSCNGAHAIAILTEWDEFVTYDWQRIYDSMQKPAFIFDGRNLLNKVELAKIGFVYHEIGV
jgi:UDPglucose 6-dehydrogenase